VVEHLPSKLQALGLISTTRQKRREGKREREKGGIFWLTVLEMQGLRPSCDDGFLFVFGFVLFLF
jgi:hypothetical protein